MTQRKAYRRINSPSATLLRRMGTERMIGLALAPQTPTERARELLWTGLRSPDVSRRASEFLWKSIHDAHKVGSYWTHIPQMHHRAVCPRCGDTESLEHILVSCELPAMRAFWALLRALARRAGASPPERSMATALSSQIQPRPTTGQNTKKGLRRLMLIATTETVHLIWKMRCEWVIGKEGAPEATPTAAAAINRWHSAIHNRFKTDQALAKTGRLDAELVRDTWVSTTECPTPAAVTDARAILQPEVLVGRLTPETEPGIMDVPLVANG
ncbi:hypothetical protein C8Q76DRAFT_797874 [Earliella scabrosa]|nr:hypothetical protein C8Q76DRAFT_797874 [Earliella scabrosa]